jgi:hypothetical protein
VTPPNYHHRTAPNVVRVKCNRRYCAAASPDRQPTISLQPGRHRLPHFAVLEVMCCWLLGAADGGAVQVDSAYPKLESTWFQPLNFKM